MNMGAWRLRLWLGSVGFGAAVLAACGCDVVTAQAPAEGTFERTLAVSGPVDLSVRTGAGYIHIRTGSDNSIQVVGHIRASVSLSGDTPAARVAQIQAHPPIDQSGNTVRVGDTANDPLYGNVSISYELVVPVNTKVRAQSGSGSETIGSLRGPVDAQTGSGSISLAQTGGDVRAMTGSGDIHAERIDGTIDAQTGSGHVRVSAVAGAVKAHTGSGSIEIRQTGRGNVDLETGSGGVTLDLPNDAAFALKVHTGSGSIHTTQPLTVQGALSRHDLQGTVRGGGASVTISTGSGSVQIR
jgi:hypothetical protein